MSASKKEWVEKNSVFDPYCHHPDECSVIWVEEHDRCTCTSPMYPFPL